jgi:ABC-type Fe3+-hydroxamate transport system substrate-binding protein
VRVVSLLPSATEILCAAGGESLLVGRSHECDWPPSITDRPVLTTARISAGSSAGIDAAVRRALEEGESLYELDVAALRDLAPDLILAQDLCRVCSIDLRTVRGVAAELSPAPTVLSLDPRSLEDVLEAVLTVGEAIGRGSIARRAVVGLRDRYWSAVDYVNPYLDGPEVVFLEWMDPLFAAGHWTPALIEAAGGRHELNPPGADSRRVGPEDLVALRPDRVIVCPCGRDLAAIRRELPALAASPWWGRLPAVREGRVALVDGNRMFNRPGPRLVDAFRWLVSWINDRPELLDPGFPWAPLAS